MTTAVTVGLIFVGVVLSWFLSIVVRTLLSAFNEFLKRHEQGR